MNRKPSLLFISSHRWGLGGGETYLLELAAALDNVYRISFVDTGANQAFVSAVIGQGFPVQSIASSKKWPAVTAAKLARHCQEYGIDLIHFNNRRDIFLAHFLSRCLELPAIMTIHTNFFSRHIPVQANLRGALAVAIGRAWGTTVERFITPTSFTARSLTQLLGIPEGKISVIPNGIRLPAAANEHSRSPVTPTICCVSRLYPEKGVDILLRSLAALRDLDWQCRIIGAGPELRRLKGQCQQLELAKQVHFLGELARPEALRHISGSQVAVLPSLYEGFPYFLLEAMAAGVPVIASRVTGLAEAVFPGVNGFLVEPRDSDALAQTLTRILQDRKLARTMGQAGRRLVDQRFTVETMANNTRDVYQEILQQRTQPEKVWH